VVSNTVYRADYQPPAFRIPSIDLHLALDPQSTTVTARLQIERAGDGPLVLDGEDLTLVSVALDGRPLEDGEYELGESSLTIPDVPEHFELETVVRINPKLNTVLEGLYLSRGLFCTQCEAEGFRRITYFLDRPDVLS
jgi:aminopeptidase N